MTQDRPERPSQNATPSPCDAAPAASRDAADAELRHRSQLLDVVLDRMGQGLMLVNEHQVVELCNRRAIELLDLPPDLMSRKPRFIDVLEYQWSTDEFGNMPEEVKQFVRDGGVLEQPELYERTRPDGRVIEIESLPLARGGVLRTYTDVTERRASEERIRHRARHDGLTNLLNREAFGELLASSIMKATIDGRGFAVHYLDLDRFKPVNDGLGHVTGDLVLASVAQRMRHVAREHDSVARLGGDEFAVLQLFVDDREQATGLAHRLVDALDAPVRIHEHEVTLGLSVGIALFPSHGVSADALLRHADAALYRVKARGGNGFEVFA